MRVITFKMDERLLEELDRFCNALGMSRSEAIRLAITQLLRSGIKIRPRVRAVELS